MTFKKDGSDPLFNPAPDRANLAFRWIGAMAASLGLMPLQKSGGQTEDQFRFKRSRGKPTPARKHRNMLHVSKRVRGKHRRAA